jgi:hypothetical protein
LQPPADEAGLALLDSQAVRDTISAVFAHPAFDQSLRQSIGDRLFDWLFRGLASVVQAVRGYGDIRWVVIALTAAVVVSVLARAAYLAAVQSRLRSSVRSRRGSSIDPWKAATVEAADGRYDEAAHLLYAAVLEAIARHDRTVLHPARTIGEYERDLRKRGSSSVVAFRAFTRAYERAIWRGHGVDRPAYETLRGLAAVLVESRPARQAA